MSLVTLAFYVKRAPNNKPFPVEIRIQDITNHTSISDVDEALKHCKAFESVLNAFTFEE